MERMLQALWDEALYTALAASSLLWVIHTIYVNTASTDENLGEGPDATYSLACGLPGGHSSGECSVNATGIFGAVEWSVISLLSRVVDEFRTYLRRPPQAY